MPLRFLLMLWVVFFILPASPLLGHQNPDRESNFHDAAPVRWTVVYHETLMVDDMVVSQLEPGFESASGPETTETVAPFENENLNDPDPMEEELVDPFADDSFDDDPFEEDPFAEEEVVIPEMTDPFHGVNRGVYAFNDGMYEYLMRPVAETYRGVVNENLRTAIRNIFDIALVPTKLISSLLQGKWGKAGRVVSRTLINTICGWGGAIDVAGQEYGIYDVDEDFAQVLGYHGVSSGPYMVLPLLGPSSVRHTVGRGVDFVLNPLFFFSPGFWESFGMATGNIVNSTTFYIDDIKTLKEGAVDPYESFKDFYHQRREILIQE